MRPKWIIGIAIGLFFLYISYFSVAGIGLTLYPLSLTQSSQIVTATGFWLAYQQGTEQNTYVATHTKDGLYHIVSGTYVASYGNAWFILGFYDLDTSSINWTNAVSITFHYWLYLQAPTFNSGTDTCFIGPDSAHVSQISPSNTLKEYTITVDKTVFGTPSSLPTVIDYVAITGQGSLYIDYMYAEIVWANPTYTIVASAGLGGFINPSGTVTVDAGQNQGFTITANANYQISDVSVDGSSVGTVSSYTFTNVQASHTIDAHFSVGPSPTYTITASAGSGGSISPNGPVIVTQGNNQTFIITPNNGYTISSVLVDGVNQGTLASYTFSNVQASHTIAASFSVLPPNQYTISASAGMGGSILPSGSVLVNQGSNQAFTITANNGYLISAVLVDGTSQGAVSTYAFTNVQVSHTISASFSSTENVNYFLLLVLDVLGNSRLMLIVGASITLVSTIMLFWPKPKPQY